MSGKTKKDFHLTEMILAIHNEVQSAVDYIKETAEQGTELGKGSAVMGIERLRLKIPFSIDIDQREKKIEERPPLTHIGHSLANRKGFLIDHGAVGKLGLYTKIKVFPKHEDLASKSEAEEESGKWQTGEMEIVFMPLKRE